MSQYLTTVIEWLKGNKLFLNVAKTKVMDTSTRHKGRSSIRNNEELSLKIQEEPIDNVLITKHLSIQVDRNLNWKGHIKALLS